MFTQYFFACFFNYLLDLYVYRDVSMPSLLVTLRKESVICVGFFFFFFCGDWMNSVFQFPSLYLDCTILLGCCKVTCVFCMNNLTRVTLMISE